MLRPGRHCKGALSAFVSFAARDIRLVMEGKPRNLIETVATDIATNILQDYRQVKGLKVSVQKPHVALDGVVKSMGASHSWASRHS